MIRRDVMLKKILLATMVAESVGISVPNVASAAVYVEVAPPAPRVEVVPAPRRGYAWVPGYWQWRHGRYVWVSGTWVRERPGYHYVSPRWVEHGGRWYMEEGRWARHDRDHDGVPNRYDHAP